MKIYTVYDLLALVYAGSFQSKKKKKKKKKIIRKNIICFIYFLEIEVYLSRCAVVVETIIQSYHSSRNASFEGISNG
jgi:hypothetical protein